MKYFEKGFIQFYSDLEASNNKQWFHSNQKRYESFDKKPMLDFVSDVLAELQKLDNEITMEAKICIGRVNRDIRFSNDKTPYKLRSYAHITKGDKSDDIPVIAFQMGAHDLSIMSGFYNPHPIRLKAIRENIIENPKVFNRLYSDQLFKDTYSEIKEIASKEFPKSIKSVLERNP